MSEGKQIRNIGDLVMVTGGPHKGMKATITAISGIKVSLRSESGEEFTGSIRFIESIESEHVNNVDVTPVADKVEQTTRTSEDETVAEVVEAELEPTAAQPEAEPAPEPVEIAHNTATTEPETTTAVLPEASSETAKETTPAPTNPIAKMTVIELQNLAKQRGISLARTKKEFLRIIQQQLPDFDTGGLKGPALFNKVTELHISRLRSKADLVELLSVEVIQ